MLTPQAQPSQPQPNLQQGMAPVQETNPVMPDGQTQGPEYVEEPMDAGPTEEEIAAHLDALPDESKAFLAEHLTPEFVTAIGLISGQEVANHLMKYADPDKVLVPVPRKVAEENLATLKAQAGGQAPQSAPAQAPSSPAPQGGMMSPMQQPATPQ